MDSLMAIEHLFAGDSAENDPYLSEYFVYTPDYHAIVDGTVLLVTGRKGTGKSSIYRMLQEKLPNRVQGLTFQDYPWQVHNTLVDDVHATELRHAHTWKFLILVTLAKQIIAERGILGLIHPKVRLLRRFLKQNYGSLAPSTAEILVDKAGRLKKVEFNPLEGSGGLELEDGTPGDSLKKLSTHVNIANSRLSEILKGLINPKKKYFILFDKLDDCWDGSEEYTSSLIGLVKATAELNTSIKGLRAVVFLRTDIYEILEFNDKGKFNARTLRVDLAWKEQDLLELIEERIHRLGKTEQRAGTWDLVFTPSNMKHKTSKLTYMVKRSYLRPRDIISFCAECQAKALKRGRLTIDNDDIYGGEEGYSKRIHQELVDEYLKHTPYLKDLFDVLKGIKRENITLEEFEPEWAKHNNLPPIDECIKTLFEISVLGIRQKGGRGGGEHFMFRYLDPKLDVPEGNTEYIVHRSLREALGLKSSRRVGVPANTGELDDDEDE